MSRESVTATLLAHIARNGMKRISYAEASRIASRIVKSSSSANRALHKLLESGLMEIQPKNIGLKVVTEYVMTGKGLDAAPLALRVEQLKKPSLQTNELPTISRTMNSD